MNQIELLRQRLLGADGVPGALAASWEGFELVRTVTNANADRSAEMYPAFTFARGAAVSGRNAIGFAPSMPAREAMLVDGPVRLAGDVYEVADAIADLASALGACLREAAGRAADGCDRTACENAARDADRINELLVKGNK